MDVFQFAFGWVDRLAEHGDSFQGIVQALAAFLQPIMKQDLNRFVDIG